MAAARTRAASTTKAPTLADLGAKFDVELYRKNPKGFHYIPIEKHIERWQEVCGAGWNLVVTNVQFVLTPGVTFGNRNPKPGAAALVSVEITAELDGKTVTRSGVGADFGAADDPDKLVKTALAEAIKKAGNEFGIGLELWDEEERALIDSAQAQGLTGQVQAAVPAAVTQLVPADDVLVELKNRVADLAESQGVARTGPSIAAHFGITLDELQAQEVLEKILVENTPSEERLI
jgi:hypothetical protein